MYSKESGVSLDMLIQQEMHSMLYKEANDWFTAIEVVCETWDHFERFFLDRYAEETSAVISLKQCMQRSQLPKETFRDYFAACCALFTQAPDDMPEFVKVTAIIAGMTPATYAEFDPPPTSIQTLTGLMMAGREVDRKFQFRRQSREGSSNSTSSASNQSTSTGSQRRNYRGGSNFRDKGNSQNFSSHFQQGNQQQYYQNNGRGHFQNLSPNSHDSSYGFSSHQTNDPEHSGFCGNNSSDTDLHDDSYDFDYSPNFYDGSYDSTSSQHFHDDSDDLNYSQNLYDGRYDSTYSPHFHDDGYDFDSQELQQIPPGRQGHSYLASTAPPSPYSTSSQQSHAQCSPRPQNSQRQSYECADCGQPQFVGAGKRCPACLEQFLQARRGGSYRPTEARNLSASSAEIGNRQYFGMDFDQSSTYYSNSPSEGKQQLWEFSNLGVLPLTNSHWTSSSRDSSIQPMSNDNGRDHSGIAFFCGSNVAEENSILEALEGAPSPHGLWLYYQQWGDTVSAI
jgi:hypothetical protein